MKAQSFFITLVLVLSLCLSACDFNGGVEQGRCVAFNASDKTLTLVEDTSIDAQNPHYSGKVFTFKLPVDEIDMGPAPEPGNLLQVEPDKSQVIIYNPETKGIQTLPMQMEIITKVNAKDKRVAGVKFPVIDKSAGTITEYSSRLQDLIILKPTPEQMALPESTWKLGEEVRVAYRNDNKEQAIRVMNVTKTSIFQR